MFLLIKLEISSPHSITPMPDTLEAAEMAMRAAYILAGNAYTASSLSTLNAKNALESAKEVEKNALIAFNESKVAWNRATEELNTAEEEVRTIRANKFRAVVNASGLTTRAPSSGLAYESDSNQSDSNQTESDVGVQYSPTSPDYTPQSSPRALSPLVSPSIIDSWQ
jgi:hypothetical protein